MLVGALFEALLLNLDRRAALLDPAVVTHGLDAPGDFALGRGELEVLSYSLPVRMLAVDGLKQKVVRFTTDIPHLPNWGQPLLLGPGSILVAHTKDEFVLKKDLETAVDNHRDLVINLLGRE